MASLQRVEGVIVRLGVPGTRYGEYLVLWSKEFNHSFVLRGDVGVQDWDDAFVCEWKEYDVALSNELPGPEGIETQAYNLRKPNVTTCDPSTRADQYYTDIHNPRRVNVFTTVEGDHLARPTVKFKDLFKVPPPTIANNSVDGVFIKRANIRAADLRDLQKFNITEFEGVVELEKVTKRTEQQPWRITQFVFDGKELSIQGWLSKKGFLLRGSRGHGMVPRSQVKIPQDGLRHNPSGAGPPSRFASMGNSAPDSPPPPPIIPFGGILEEQIPSHSPPFPEDQTEPLPPSLSEDTSPAPATISSVVIATTTSPSPESWSEEEFPGLRESPSTQVVDVAPAANDGVVITRTVLDVTPIELVGVVVHQEDDSWVFYCKNFSNSTRTYLYLDPALPVVIGKWYSLMVKGGCLPEVIDFHSVAEIEQIDPPTGIDMRVFTKSDNPALADILIATKAAVVLTGGSYHIFCSKLGSLCHPDDAENFVDFSKMKMTVVELTFDAGGLLVRRFHGPKANVKHLPDPIVPYDITTQEDADDFFSNPFMIPSNCYENWIKKEEFQADSSIHSASVDHVVNPSIQPPSPNVSHELNELSITATPHVPIISRFATPDDASSSPKPPRSACRALFPREQKFERSASHQSGLSVEGTRYRTHPNWFCGLIDSIYDIVVDLTKESVDTTFIIEVMAMIALVKEEYIVAYCPLKDYDKIIIPLNVFRQSKYVAEGHPVEPGNWMSMHVHPRQPQPFDTSSPPHFSHIATSDPECAEKLCHVDITDCVDTWEQRCIDGQFQFSVMINLSERYITATHLGQAFYIFETKQDVDVIVPAYRFEPLKGMDYPQFVRFWAVRGLFVFSRTLHLVADAEVEVIKDGKTMTYLTPFGHPPLKMVSATEQMQLADPKSRSSPEVDYSPLPLNDIPPPEDISTAPPEIPMPPPEEIHVLSHEEHLVLEEAPVVPSEEFRLLPQDEIPWEGEMPLNDHTLDNAYSDRCSRLEEASSGFSCAEDGQRVSCSMEDMCNTYSPVEPVNEFKSLLHDALFALLYLTPKEITDAFHDEGLEDELEYLIGLRDAVCTGEVSIDAINFTSESMA